MSIEITDEMVERAMAAHGSTNPHERTRWRMRAALTAALSPPPAPEIVVTEDMRKAGVDEWSDWCAGRHPQNCDEYAKSGGMVGRIYRAMRALEPKPVKPRFFRKDAGVSVEDERKGERRTKDNASAWLYWKHYNAQERRNVYAGDRRKEGKQ